METKRLNSDQDNKNSTRELNEKVKTISYREAVELYNKAISTNNEELREQYINKIVVGTIPVLDKFIKRSGLESLSNSRYDIDDIRSALTIAWIKSINSGKLLKSESWSQILNNPAIFNEIHRNLGEEEPDTKEKLGISIYKLSYLFRLYIKEKNEGRDTNIDSLLDLIEEKQGITAYYSFYDIFYCYDRVLKPQGQQIILLLENIYDRLPKDEFGEVKISLSKADRFIKTIISNGYQEEMTEEILAEDLIEKSLDRIKVEHLGEDLGEVLVPNEEFVLKERFGLDGKVPKSLDAVGKELDRTPQRIRQIEAKAIKKLRHPRNKIKIKYYND